MALQLNAGNNNNNNNNNSNSNKSWPPTLLTSTSDFFIDTLKCIRCKQIPIVASTDAKGNVYCLECAGSLHDQQPLPNPGIQNVINNLRTKCLSLRSNANSPCQWNGSIAQWQEQHGRQCPFVLTTCEKCKRFQCERRHLRQHLLQCPEEKIACPLGCGLMILRKNENSHRTNDCPEQLVVCTNYECKTQIGRRHLQHHATNECGHRLVACEFVKFGCLANAIKAKDVGRHCEEHQVQHVTMKFEAQLKEQQVIIHKLQNQMNEQNQRSQATIHQLQDQMAKMQTANQTRTQSIDEQANGQRMTIEELLEQINRQNHTIKHQEASVTNLQAFNDSIIEMYRHVLGMPV